jgi:L-alanine-DL-glutamate epimerase-like enolase superfamily enzyme
MTLEAGVTRLAKIDTFLIRYPDPNDFNFDRQTVVLRAETKDGVTGWGEAIAMWPEACRAVQLLIAEGMKPILVGEDALATEARWRQMRRHTWWYGEGGLASMAISAIDIALWDIRGKIEGRPLYQLLGGLKKHRLAACASSHVNKATVEECVAEVASFFEQGFRSCKLGFAKKGKSSIGRNLDKDIEFIQALRAALGPKAEILVDAGNGVQWDVETAINAANQMLELGVGWLEEPLYPTHDAEYRQLKAATRMPIASGEREFTVAGYRRLMESGSVDIIGVDPARAEGVTGFAKVDALAGQFHKTMNAHAWSTAITTAASLHLSLASENTRLFEFKPFEVVGQQDLVAEPIWHRDGWAYPVDSPGLGVEVRENVVEKLTVHRS